MSTAAYKLIPAGCILAVILSWFIVMISKTPAEKQLELIEQAQMLMRDEIYVKAALLLEEAAELGAGNTSQAEEELKKAYLALAGNSSRYARKYTSLLEKQMSLNDAPPEIYLEAANYKLSENAPGEALRILKTGIEKTGDAQLEAMYERNRYIFDTGRNVYNDVTAIYNGTIGVCVNDKWGIIRTDGTMVLPCEYDKVSTFYQDTAIVKKDGLIYAVDRDNHRIALAPSDATDFRNLSDGRTALLTQTAWRRATKDFVMGTNEFEDIAMHSGGYAAVKTGGKWGVISVSGKWMAEAHYDEIMQDELGRCYGQGAVFAREGERVYMLTDKGRSSESYQYARPFANEGCAAVMSGGKWGFIDIEGNVEINFIFEDALSFSGHLAAVKVNGMWGYINTNGEIAIDAEFLQAGSFSDGCAPVLTEKGWQLITLIEYKKAKGLV